MKFEINHETDDEKEYREIMDVINYHHRKREIKENPKCSNCEEQEVEHEGEWCDSCNYPKKGDPVM